jgi:site-specific DNA-methyltransferase (adenine-specific)
VLDPFAGCATTCVAAERLGRNWVGIDINEEARDVIHERLQREVSQNMAWYDIVRTPAEPPKRTDGGEPVVPELVLVRRRGARRLPLREIREQLEAADGRRCQGCGWAPPYLDYLQVDHKRPRSLGGKDDMENLTLLCDPCNRLKSNKLTLQELRQARVDEGRIDAAWWEVERWR